MMEIYHEIGDENAHLYAAIQHERTAGLESIRPRRSEHGRLELRPGLFAARGAEAMPLVPEGQWPGRIKDLAGRFAADRDDARSREDTDQDGKGYCWAASLTQCCERKNADQDGTYNELAWESLGGAVNWRNQGNYLDSAVAYAAKHGIAPRAFVPWNCINPRQFNAGWEQAALRFVPLEWYDLGPTKADVWSQTVSWILAGGRVYAAYNWWGHAVCLDSLVMVGSEVCVSGPNSWGKNQRYVLKGSKKYPDEGYAVRSVVWDAARGCGSCGFACGWNRPGEGKPCGSLRPEEGTTLRDIAPRSGPGTRCTPPNQGRLRPSP